MGDSQLEWGADPMRYGAMVADRGDGTRYYMVWQEPCWCLRHEERGKPMRWMGQYFEPGGIDTAKRVAQKDYELFRQVEAKRLRREAWERYMETHDPPED